MYTHHIHQQVKQLLQNQGIESNKASTDFAIRLTSNAYAMHALFMELYGHRPDAFDVFLELIQVVVNAHTQRSEFLKQTDLQKLDQEHWFLSNKLVGMSLYVDRWAGNLKGVLDRLDYFEELGVNLLHLMPLFSSPENESDGGYAVSDFRTVDPKFGSLTDLEQLRQEMHRRGMHLMLDIVLNHTSDEHAWAVAARQGDEYFRQFYYLYPDRTLPDAFEATMPEVFPESAPGSFTWVPDLQQWVMTVFHQYQWDLNYTNPAVLVAMMDTMFFYANLGVDILRVDAPAFVWKKLGTTGQNLPEAHTLLRIIRLCFECACPGMALLGEAIVSPSEIIRYFGDREFTARECDFAYNATHMALQWDALASGDCRVMMAARHQLLRKPYGTSWITYTRCHDDIGLGYDDYMIQEAGFDPSEHRKFIKNYFSGNFPGSPAMGALFAVNPKSGDARISGTLASLCGLEYALKAQDEHAVEQAIQKVVMMQAHSFFIGGIPMLFYGDELGTLNDYSYTQDEGKSYDNRWMHRPLIRWEETNYRDTGTVAGRVFNATKRLIDLRKRLAVLTDKSNLDWMTPHNVHIAGFVRWDAETRLYALFNFSAEDAWLTWFAFFEKGLKASQLKDHCTGRMYRVGTDAEYLVLPPYGFMLLEAVD